MKKPARGGLFQLAARGRRHRVDQRFEMYIVISKP